MVKPTSFDFVLETLVDLEAYPLLAPNSLDYASAVKSAQAGLNNDGCARIEGFIRAEQLEQLREESMRLAPNVQVKQSRFTPYISVDESFPDCHPRRRIQDATNGFVTRDLIPESALIQKLYGAPAFKRFLADCFDKPVLHEFADPMRGLVVNVMPEDTTLPWHFDTNEFIVSLMTVKPDSGGLFEYCPGIRAPGSENYDDVRAVLDGWQDPVKTLELDVGDLQLFMGRYALHRVCEGKGERHTAIFGYSEDAGYIGTADSTRQAYGRCMQAHIDADQNRLVDGLAG
ncbi:hypothetical protein ABVF61_30555 [Roseibium sp. HPY-6]|uniref:HalD/BesD family halogenase n=1 Tax=Roseibium sp. HPY-6 TaxID=3229852 RepID=UPI00338EA184